METSPLRDWAKAVPFIPFTVSMSNGRQVQITSPEMIILGHRWGTVAFVDDQAYDRIVVIQHAQINTIDAYVPVQTPPPPEQGARLKKSGSTGTPPGPATPPA